jgi:hypothetical protein
VTVRFKELIEGRALQVDRGVRTDGDSARTGHDDRVLAECRYVVPAEMSCG